MDNYYHSLISVKARFFIGLVLLFIIFIFHYGISNYDQIESSMIRAFVVAVLLWLVSAGLTDKYNHKYPRHYFSYAFAAHLKAFFIVIILLLLLLLFRVVNAVLFRELFLILIIFSLLDFLFSLPKKKIEAPDPEKVADSFYAEAGERNNKGVQKANTVVNLDLEAVEQRYGETLAPEILDLFKNNIKDNSSASARLTMVSDLDELEAVSMGEKRHESVIVCTTSLNYVHRLNNLLKDLAATLKMGGYLAVSYRPLKLELEELKKGSSKLIYPFRYLKHFIWYRALPKLPWIANIYFSPPFSWIDRLRRKVDRGPRRVLAKAEVWGRLVYYGLEIVEEQISGNQAYVLARKVAQPSTNKEPTFHPVVTLEKVGLEGKLIRTHKVRSMYAFSEFLQKNIFEMHGLNNTGKFKNDFRLTDYGPFIRKYWIDEIPGIYDWLRGDIKLVGLRATSPQYLSLYPREFFKLYIQVKPGLIPPIFDKDTTGFEQIVLIEQTYLERYLDNPWRTDLCYLWYTIRDIFVRRVRSK